MRRVLSAGVALPLLVLLVRYGEPVHFAALVAVAAAAGTWEVLRLVAFPGGRLTRAVGVAAGAALAFGGYLRPPLALALALWTVVLVFFSAALWLPSGAWARPRGAAGGTLGILFVGATFGSLAMLRNLGDGWRWVFFLLLIVWGGDTAAFYAGRAWGRRPLSRRLSPNKTVEGALAGLAASVAAGLLARLWFLADAGWMAAATGALLLGAVGQAGDLAESALKRGAGVKDAGRLIPGHGGVLDRLDGLSFAGPVLYAAHRLWGFP